MQKGLQLNPDSRSTGGRQQLQAVASVVSTVSAASVNLPVAYEMKVLGVFLDRHLAFDKHVQLWCDHAITIYSPSATYVTCR